MYIILPAIIVNILATIVLSMGLLYNFEQPKIKAVYGYCVAGSMISYIAILTIAAIYGLIIKQNLYNIILLLCAISPFIIGKLVKYETLRKYTIIQIICFTASLVILLLNI